VLLCALLLSASAGAAEPERYLALGDSFTAGTGALPSESFPARLVARWKKSGVDVQLENPASNGFTTQDVIDEELPALETFKPSIVSLAIGANDLVRGSDEKRYRAQLKRIFKAILDAGVKPTAIFAIPQPAWSEAPISEAFGDRAELRRKIERFNEILKEEAKTAGARYLDLWPLMVKNDHKVAPDGLHPSVEAYDAMAAEIAKQLPLKPTP
jgi:lysophospholipase L1-like esterase